MKLTAGAFEKQETDLNKFPLSYTSIFDTDPGFK